MTDLYEQTLFLDWTDFAQATGVELRLASYLIPTQQLSYAPPAFLKVVSD